MDIQVLQKSVPLISTTTLTAETLAKELKIPKSHLELIFKYYCNYSINDFGNLVKVSYSLSLIREGYLENYTVAYLGEICLFNSRFTFSKNFKKFTGVSVSDFVKSQTKTTGLYPIWFVLNTTPLCLNIKPFSSSILYSKMMLKSWPKPFDMIIWACSSSVFCVVKRNKKSLSATARWREPFCELSKPYYKRKAF